MIVITNSGERYKLRSGQNRIGRGSDTDLQVEGSDVSRHHAIIRWEDGNVQIMDMGSTNGTSLNGRKLEAYEYVTVSVGDKIELGSGESAEKLVIEAEEAEDADVAAASTVVMNVSDILAKVGEEQKVTAELVGKAYEALATGDMEKIKAYWDEGVNWLIPGSNPLSGWHKGLDAFIAYLMKVSSLTGNNLKTQSVALMVGGEYSADVTRNSGYRAGYDESSAQKPDTRLDVEVVHVLRWRNGKIIEGRTAIFGEGAEEYDRFWSFNGS